MYSIQRLSTETFSILNKSKVTLPIDFSISVNARLQCYGRALYERNIIKKTVTPKRIEYSNMLLKIHDEEQVKQIILHECAHIIAAMRDQKHDHGHDYYFKNICQEIGCTFDTPYGDFEIVKESHKYDIYCPHCGLIGYKTKKCDLTEHPSNYCCSQCNTAGLTVVKNW